jgi:5-methylcytosine-specific restriction endonuclease McrA
MLWRWDQGRSAYFRFDAITKIAPVLLKYNGADMKLVDSQFRADIMQASGLPFAPSTYTIKRNYKRVFECMMLSSYIGQRLIISEIGRAIANQDSTLGNVDGYLFEVEKRFRYPYPAFDNYNDVKGICFPFIAMLKLLLAKAISANNPNAVITLNDVGAYLIANDVNGLEPLEFYKVLQPKANFTFDSYGSNDQKRQVREMMHFIGQHSFINDINNDLYLMGLSVDDCITAFNSLIPNSTEVTSRTPIDDFLQITSYTPIGGQYESQYDLDNFSVQEGRKVFKSHFSYERKPQLRKEFIKRNPTPVCDVCGQNMHIIYPWTENMLEIHHIRPLSSHEDTGGNHHTSLEDVVGICPSCHRAIHLYYKKYLTSNELQDFISNENAEEVYNEAKSIVRSNG